MKRFARFGYHLNRHDSGSKRNRWKNEPSESKRSWGSGGRHSEPPPARVLGGIAPYGTFFGLLRPLDPLKINSNFINCGYEARQKSYEFYGIKEQNKREKELVN